MTASTFLDPVSDAMPQVEALLRGIDKVGIPWMESVLQHILRSSGKRVRPALVLLAGQVATYDLDLLVPMAAAVELLHTATLVHDDTVDKSALRRGIATINSLWNGETAVLVGDYLFANSADLVSTTGNVRVMRLFAQTLMHMAAGELSQVFSAYRWQQTREEYYQRIGRKTAVLFAMATESGAVLGSANEPQVQALKSYGQNLGLAFQLVDDILDFTGSAEELGKPAGSDLMQGTLTLPALLLLERYPQDNPVRSALETHGSPELVQQAIEMARNSSVIDEAYAEARAFSLRARAELHGLPDCPARQAMAELAESMLERRA
ncbi:MAG: polyprenyl synthetase family protein [Chloroflexi bacterium]|nr:polyprenyl synthetase family protein [Chloroflexota bacterium]